MQPPYFIASHSVASARTALVCLHELPQPVPLAATTLSAPKPLASPCYDRSPVWLSSPSLALERLPASPQSSLPPRFKTHRLPASSDGFLQIVVSQATNSLARRSSSCWLACDTTLRLINSYPTTLILGGTFQSLVVRDGLGRSSGGSETLSKLMSSADRSCLVGKRLLKPDGPPGLRLA